MSPLSPPHRSPSFSSTPQVLVRPQRRESPGPRREHEIRLLRGGHHAGVHTESIDFVPYVRPVSFCVINIDRAWLSVVLRHCAVELAARPH